jgi:hypothetical protein
MAAVCCKLARGRLLRHPPQCAQGNYSGEQSRQAAQHSVYTHASSILYRTFVCGISVKQMVVCNVIRCNAVPVLEAWYGQTGDQ